jgi:hypothetical protein
MGRLAGRSPFPDGHFAYVLSGRLNDLDAVEYPVITLRRCGHHGVAVVQAGPVHAGMN